MLKKAEEQPLKDCLLNYQVEIQQQLISFPNLASRYQLIISNCLINNHLVLDDRQAKLAQAISDTLSIRYM
ncbi:hypothetical protein [Vagococcus penaei]|uniref:hypothetical protein n=1 Tax=Vagococcus penaei TaxID=633807 RepID=UPI000F87AC9D|nr:hypothetical protein [Vagococcus penaei]